MFTIDEIKAAHAKVKSGSDFPNYIQDLIKLGVTGYQTYLADGHTAFEGSNGFHAGSESKYAARSITDRADESLFRQHLVEHQQGKSTYPDFCQQAANDGVEKWEVNMAAMTCTYFDKAGKVILQEKIPG